MPVERTLVIIKPDGMERKLGEAILGRYVKAGLRVVAKKEMKATTSLLRTHYAAHVHKDFYPVLEAYMMESEVIACVLEGENAIATVRKITGATDPSKAEKGTIRGDLGDDSKERADKEKRSIRNLVHASGTMEEADVEIKLWFPEGVTRRILLDTNTYGWALEDEKAAMLIALVIDEQRNEHPRLRVFGYDVIRAELERNPHNDTKARTLKLYAAAMTAEIRTDESITSLAEDYFSKFKEENVKMTIEDCEIVAAATVNGVDFIVSDNRRTLNSPRAKSIFKEINNAKELSTPAIATAEEAVTTFSF